MASVQEFSTVDVEILRRREFLATRLAQLKTRLEELKKAKPRQSVLSRLTLENDLQEMGFAISDVPTAHDIRQRYRNLAKQLHPDRNVGNDEAAARFGTVNDAHARLAKSVERIEDEVASAGHRLQKHFQAFSHSGGWVDATSSEGHHTSSFPIEHLTGGQRQALRDALEAQGYQVEEHYCSSLTADVYSVSRGMNARVNGEQVHQALQQHFDPTVRSQATRTQQRPATTTEVRQEVVESRSALVDCVPTDGARRDTVPEQDMGQITVHESAVEVGRERMVGNVTDPILKEAEQAVHNAGQAVSPSVPLPTISTKPFSGSGHVEEAAFSAGLGERVVKAEKGVVDAFGKAERSVVTSSEHSWGRFAKPVLIAAGVAAAVALTVSYLRKKPLPSNHSQNADRQEDSASRTSENVMHRSYDLGSYGLTEPTESWVSRVKGARTFTLER